MKILAVSNFFPPDVVGGYELGCRSILGALATKAEVHVLTSCLTINRHAENDHEGITVHPVFEPCLFYALPANRRVREYQLDCAFAGFKTANVLALRDAITKLRPDLVYLFNIMGLGPLGMLETSVESGVPTVCHLMDDWDSAVSAHCRTVDIRSGWARTKAKCSAIACSGFTRESNSRIGEFGSTTVIPGGFPFPEALPTGERIPPRGASSISDNFIAAKAFITSSLPSKRRSPAALPGKRR